MEWFEALTPGEAAVVLTDEALGGLHERKYGLPPRNFPADETEGQKEFDPDISHSQSPEIPVGCFSNVEQFASNMWVPSRNDVALNPTLYREGLFEVDIGVRSLRWKQSATNTGRSIDIVELRRKADVGQRDLAMLLDIAPQRLSD